jgi:hypothetical protein
MSIDLPIIACINCKHLIDMQDRNHIIVKCEVDKTVEHIGNLNDMQKLLIKCDDHECRNQNGDTEEWAV